MLRSHLLSSLQLQRVGSYIFVTLSSRPFIRMQVNAFIPHNQDSLTDADGRLSSGLRGQWKQRWLTLHDGRVYRDAEACVRRFAGDQR